MIHKKLCTVLSVRGLLILSILASPAMVHASWLPDWLWKKDKAANHGLWGIDSSWSRNIEEIEKAKEGKIPIIQQLLQKTADQMKRIHPSSYTQKPLERVLDKERLENLQWYNTLLTRDDAVLGLYKGDIVEAGRFAADMAIDQTVRKHLLKKRIDHILESMKEECIELLSIIDHVEQCKDEWDASIKAAQEKNRWLIVNWRLRTAQANPLINYIQDKHRCFGILPLSTTSFLPLLMQWGWHKFSENSIAKRYAPKLEDKHRLLWTASLSAQSFKVNDKGETVVSDAIPFFPVAPVRWLTGGLRFLYDPFRPVWGRLNEAKELNQKFWLRKVVPVPELLTSDTAFTIYDFLGVCFGAKLIDQMYTARWTDFVLKHRLKLRSLLLAYSEAVKKGTNVAFAEDDLKKFIEKAHRDKGVLPGSMVGTWLQAIRSGQTVMPYWIGVAIAGSLIARGYLFYRALFKA